MRYCNSSDFFEIPIEHLPGNGAKARLFCLKDFLKKCLIFPFVLIVKACKTFFRLAGVVCSAGWLLVTLGSALSAREWFVRRVTYFAQDAADWILLPLAFLLCFFRLMLALFVRPALYFNAV